VTSRTACNIRDVTPGTLTTTDTCIGYHVTRFETSRNVILHTRYVSTCVGAGCGRSRRTKKTKAIRCGACYSIVLNAHRVTSMADTDIDATKSTGLCICLRLDLYMSHVKKYNRYALQNNTCDMYMSSLRHIHDPVLSSLKMKCICLLFPSLVILIPQISIFFDMTVYFNSNNSVIDHKIVTFSLFYWVDNST
jgi:hypothetical protein